MPPAWAGLLVCRVVGIMAQARAVFDPVRLALAWLGSARLGSARLGLARLGSAWLMLCGGCCVDVHLQSGPDVTEEFGNIPF